MRPKTITRSQHPISRKDIDSDALKVLYRLYRAGHTAYLVGGGTRDLLLRRKPKDFDVVTSARPAQIKNLFRNCRLIGRRFRLAHIHFAGGKLIEVSTFRRDPEDDDSDDLLVRNDNTFGTPGQDALRRDFTINGLFYNIEDFTLIDYVGGVEDIKRKVIRTIRDPRVRFQEDPIRMIRAIKFAARLGFDIERDTWQAIIDFRSAIEKSAQPRIHEEMARILEEGAASRSIKLLDDSGLLEYLEPNLEAYIRMAERGRIPEDPQGDLLFRILEQADAMKQQGHSLTRPTLFAACLYPLMLHEGLHTVESPDLLIREGVTGVLHRLGLSRKDTDRVEQILLAQRRLRPRGNKAQLATSLLGKSYFDESYALFSIIAAATGEGAELVQRWGQLIRKRDGTPNRAIEVGSPQASDSAEGGGEAALKRVRVRFRRRLIRRRRRRKGEVK